MRGSHGRTQMSTELKTGVSAKEELKNKMTLAVADLAASLT